MTSAMMKAKIQVTTNVLVWGTRNVIQGDQHTKDSSPDAPAEDSVLILVAGVLLKDTEEDETGRDGGVQDAKEDEGGNHEREGNLLVQGLERAKGGGGHVLVADVGVDDSTDNAEEENLSNGARPQSLGELAGILHLGNEARKRDLSNECVADVHKGVQGGDKGSASNGDGSHNRLATDGCGAVSCGVGRAGIVTSRVRLDTGEDSGQEDRDKSKDGRCSAELGQHAKGARKRRNPANNHDDNAKADSAAGNIIVGGGHGVKILGANEDVETLSPLVVALNWGMWRREVLDVKLLVLLMLLGDAAQTA